MVTPRWHLINIIVLILAVIGLFTSAAHGDGKVFGRAEAVVTIPGQQALIHFADGVQTLVIETRFQPSAANSAAAGADAPFAWVVPVPGPRAAGGGVPEVSAVTTGVFPTLRTVCSPRATGGVKPLYIPALALTLLVVAMAALRSSLAKIAIVIAACVVLLAVLLPALGTARSSGGHQPSAGVDVMDRRMVGSFDVSIVGSDAADAGRALHAWLTREGYFVPAAARPVINSYAKEGWVFVAAKLRGDSAPADQPLTPHPLAIRFKTAQAVYPMRLTAVESTGLLLDLYVFGDQQARADGLDVVRCARVTVNTDESDLASFSPLRFDDTQVGIGHPGVARIIGQAPIVTKLSGRLSPPQMLSDVRIGWESFRPRGGHVYSRPAAATLALNTTFIAWLLGMAVVIIVGAIRRTPENRRAVQALVVFGPCVIAGLIVRAAVPVSEVMPGRERVFGLRTMHVLREAAEKLDPKSLADAAPDQASQVVREHVDHYFADLPSRRRITVPHMDDSPGNYMVRATNADTASARVELLGFDQTGRGVRIASWSLPPRTP